MGKGTRSSEKPALRRLINSLARNRPRVDGGAGERSAGVISGRPLDVSSFMSLDACVQPILSFQS